MISTRILAIPEESAAFRQRRFTLPQAARIKCIVCKASIHHRVTPDRALVACGSQASSCQTPRSQRKGTPNFGCYAFARCDTCTESCSDDPAGQRVFFLYIAQTTSQTHNQCTTLPRSPSHPHKSVNTMSPTLIPRGPELTTYKPYVMSQVRFAYLFNACTVNRVHTQAPAGSVAPTKVSLKLILHPTRTDNQPGALS